MIQLKSGEAEVVVDEIRMHIIGFAARAGNQHHVLCPFVVTEIYGKPPVQIKLIIDGKNTRQYEKVLQNDLIKRFFFQQVDSPNIILNVTVSSQMQNGRYYLYYICLLDLMNYFIIQLVQKI